MTSPISAISTQLSEQRIIYRDLYEQKEKYPSFTGTSVLEWHAHHDQRKQLEEAFHEVSQNIDLLEERRSALLRGP